MGLKESMQCEVFYAKTYANRMRLGESCLLVGGRGRNLQQTKDKLYLPTYKLNLKPQADYQYFIMQYYWPSYLISKIQSRREAWSGFLGHSESHWVTRQRRPALPGLFRARLITCKYLPRVISAEQGNSSGRNQCAYDRVLLSHTLGVISLFPTTTRHRTSLLTDSPFLRGC